MNTETKIKCAGCGKKVIQKRYDQKYCGQRCGYREWAKVHRPPLHKKVEQLQN